MSNSTANNVVTENPSDVVGTEKQKKKLKVPSGTSLIILYAALIILFASVSKFFFTLHNFLNIGLAISVMGVMAFASTAVIISGGIDLSIGSIVALVGVTVTILQSHGMPLWIDILAGIAIGAVVGLLNGILITYLKINALITTLATMSIFSGLAFVMSGGLTSTLSGFTYLGQGYILGIPVSVVVLIIVFVIAFIVMKYTLFGRTIYAIGGNPEASRLAGINVKKMGLLIYVISGLSAAIGGLMLLSQLSAGAPQSGTGMELDVIAAVILGGCSLTGGKGTVIGTLLGVLIMGTVDNGLVLMNVNSYYQNVVRGLILLLAVGADQLKVLRKM